MTLAPAPPAAAAAPNRMLLQRALAHRSLTMAAILLGVFALLALLAPWIVWHDPYKQNLLARMRPPVFLGGTWLYPLGTDALGRDMFGRLLYGMRISLMVGLVTATVAALIGTTLGVVAGYCGGRVDAFVQFIINVRLAMPIMLVALAAASLFGGSLFVVVSAMGLLLWDRFAVVLRSATLQIRGMDYIAAAETLGTPAPTILLKDVLPNLSSQLIVILTLEMAHAIILEAALSFLGLGIQPPTPSLGLMVAEGKEQLMFESWMIMVPGAVLFLLVLAINLFGDGVRDITVPEGRN